MRQLIKRKIYITIGIIIFILYVGAEILLQHRSLLLMSCAIIPVVVAIITHKKSHNISKMFLYTFLVSIPYIALVIFIIIKSFEIPFLAVISWYPWSPPI